MAFLKKRGNVWYASWWESGPKRRKRWKALSPNKEEAYRKLVNLNKDLIAIRYGHEARIRSWAYLKAEYVKYSETNKKNPKSHKRTLQVLRNFEDVMFPRDPNDLRNAKLEDYKAERKGQVTPGTVNRELGVLKAMARFAQQRGYKPREDQRDVPKLKVDKKHPFYFDLKAIKAIREACWDEFELVMVEIGWYTGMRREEISYLDWPDVDFEKQIIRVRGKEGWIPKDFEERDIPLLAPLEEILLKWRKQATSRPVLSISGGRANPNYMGALFRSIVEKSVGQGSFHTLRHTYASHLVNAGVDLYVVSKLLGHASTTTTEIYAHLDPKRLREAAVKIPF